MVDQNQAVSDSVAVTDYPGENIGSFLLNQSKNINPHGSTQIIMAEGALRNVNV